MIEMNCVLYEPKNNEKKYLSANIEIPRICCHCKNTGEQFPLQVILTPSNENADGCAFTACSLCHKVTMHYLAIVQNDDEEKSFFFNVTKTIPTTLSKIHFSDSIQDVSKDFLEIYAQADKAEKSGLDKIAGMGYRKAIEFLVSDYLKWLNIGIDKSWIEDSKTSLSQKIKKIPDQRIRDAATAITYLGNDQTHYAQRHPEYGIDSMKGFINLLVADITNEITHREVKQLLDK